MSSNLDPFTDEEDYLKPSEHTSSIGDLDSVFFRDYNSDKISHLSSDLNYFDSYEHELLCQKKVNHSCIETEEDSFSNSTSCEKKHNKPKNNHSRRHKMMNTELKEKLLRNNRESARRSRRRKKETLDRLMKENVELRKELSMFKTKLHSCLCRHCKEKLNMVSPERKSFINTGHVHKFITKPLVLFTTFTTLICVLFNFGEGIFYKKFFR